MDGTEICRVCRGEGTPDHPLFYPCKCSGSMKYIHQDCLEEWLEHSHKKYCEICNYQFSFSPIYDDSAPEKLSPFVLLKAMFKKTFTLNNIYFRIVLAMSFWLVWVPYITHWIWVFFDDPTVFMYTSSKVTAVVHFIYLLIHHKENEELFKETVTSILQRFSLDVFHGQIISVIAILVGLVALCIKEYADFRRNRIVVNNDQPFQQVIQLEEQLLREQQILDRQRQQLEQQQQQQRRLQQQQLQQQIHDFEMFLNNLDEANRLRNENQNENNNASESLNNNEDNEFESENGNDNKTVSSENDSKTFDDQKDKINNDEATSSTSKNENTHSNEMTSDKLEEEIKQLKPFNYLNDNSDNKNENNVIVDNIELDGTNESLIENIFNNKENDLISKKENINQESGDKISSDTEIVKDLSDKSVILPSIEDLSNNKGKTNSSTEHASLYKKNEYDEYI